MRNITTTLVIVGLLTPPGAQALGIGEIKLHSYLNQPLSAEIPLVLSGEQLSQIRISLAAPGEFAKIGLQRSPLLTKLRFDPVQKRDGTFAIRVRSIDVIPEPFLSFVVELNWPEGRMLRSFTVLLDPPNVLKDSPQAATLRPAAAEALDTDTPAVDGEKQARPRELSPPTSASTSRPLREPYGPVARNERLWNIAERLNVDPSISTEQMVKALFRLNPQAFNRSNINSLSAGAYLRIPERDDILQASRPDVGQDPNPMRSGHDVIASIEPVRNRPLADSPTIEPPLLSEVRGARKESPASPETPTRSLDAEGTRALDKLRRENEQIRSRVAELEKRVTELTRLLAEQPPLLAPRVAANEPQATPPLPTAGHDASGNAAAAAAPATVTLIDTTTGTPASRDTSHHSLAVDATPAIAATDAAVAIQPGAESPPPAAAGSSEPTSTPAATSAAGPLAKDHRANTQSAPADADAGGFDIPWNWALAAAGALGAALLGLAARRRWTGIRAAGLASSESQHADANPLPMKSAARTAPAGMMNQAFTDQAAPEDLTSPEPAPSIMTEVPSVSSDQDVADALFEADIYVSYGKFRQAEEAAKKAIALDPTRPASHLKLLEVYVSGHDPAAFATHVAELRSTDVISDHDFWGRADAMAASLGTSPTSLEPAADATGGDEPHTPSKTDATGELIAKLKRFSLDGKPTQAVAPETPVNEAVDEQLQPLSGNGPTPEETRELGFEIPAGSSATLSETANLASEAENLIPYEPPSLPASDIGPTDFDDDSARSIEDLLKELSAIHFEEHLNGKPATDGNPGLGRGEEVSGSRSALDDAQIEPRHEIPSTGDAGEPADLEQKLDLARAYVDMADFDQARVILSEVIAYGTPEQRSEAEELSARLASL